MPPSTVKETRSPALAVSAKMMSLVRLEGCGPAKKLCTIPELFTMPAPRKLRALLPVALMAKALAPGLKTRLSKVVVSVTEMSVVFDKAKVAVSAGSFGTVAGDQFSAVCQSLLNGWRSQVAL